MRMKCLSAIGLLFFGLVAAPGWLTAQDSYTPLAEMVVDSNLNSEIALADLTDDMILQRLKQLPNTCIAPKVTGVVRSYIRTYAASRSEKTRVMLGKRLTYFPLFEQKLKEHDVPLDMKYLAVVESALNPRAVSRVGATGLWQFMPVTGKEYDMLQTSTVDERSDAVKSTDAAARYLKHLYQVYDDWALALAAYNSGPGRVNAAIKRAHSRNFWQIQHYLPQETRNYVPAFIAASYICNFFHLHGIDQEIPPFDEQLTTWVKVYDALTFEDIAKATGLELETISNLNAGYKRSLIPATERGHYVLLPQRVMPAFVQYLNGRGGSYKYAVDEKIRFIGGDMGDGKYAHVTISAGQDEHVDQLAEKLGCSGEQLKAWNLLKSNYVEAGQKLKIWRPIHVLRHENLRVEAPGNTAAASKPKPAAAPDKAAKPAAAPSATAPAAPAPVQVVWHTVQRAETLGDIARQYNVPEQQIRANNKFGTLKVGMRLKIK